MPCQLAENDDAARASGAAGVLGTMLGVRDPSLNSRCHSPWSWHALAGRLRAYVYIVDDVGAICRSFLPKFHALVERARVRTDRCR